MANKTPGEWANEIDAVAHLYGAHYTAVLEIICSAMRQAEKEALEWAARSCKRYAAHARGWVTSAPDYVEACEDIRKAFLARIKELSDE